jgi:hypothetical protein
MVAIEISPETITIANPSVFMALARYCVRVESSD